MPSRLSSPPRAELPAELNHLVTLHTSFLTALSLHYAHNGTSIPVDIRILAPSISSIWGKRRVTLEDIKLCLGIMDSTDGSLSHPFTLSDYGAGKICLEISEQLPSGPLARPIDENALYKLFTENISSLWQSFVQTHMRSHAPATRTILQQKKRGRPSKKSVQAQPTIDSFMTEASLNAFFTQLPQASITVCESLVKVAPLREKGRKRLRDFKESAEQARSASFKKTRPTIMPTPDKENEPAHARTQTQVQTKITSFATTRKSNLLDRILAKQEAAAKLPNPPSAAELERKAALQRSEEVLSVLSLLASSKGMAGQRVSFSMAALLQSLKGSMRSPVSKEEAIKCIEILANEVAPGFVNLVSLGSMQSVVVHQALRPLDLRMRLVSLGAEF